MEKKFKQGDLVKLKSGSPVMTVSQYFHEGDPAYEAILCKWFENAKLNKGYFKEEMLLLDDSHPSEK